MPPDLTPNQRSLRARQAAHAKHAKYDPVESTQPARNASPGSDHYWEQQVDPTGELTELERRRRAQSAKKAYFTGLALRSSKARRRSGGGADGTAA